MIAGLGFTANADFYGSSVYWGAGSAIDDAYVLSASYVTMNYGESVTIEGTPSFTITHPDGSVETSNEVTLGTPMESMELKSSEEVTFAFSIMDWETWQTPAGEYVVTIPAGVVTNGSETNAMQTIKFIVVSPADGLGDDEAVITPPQSIEDFDENWNPIPAPVYSSDELKNVTIKWTDYVLTNKNDNLPVTATLEPEMSDGPLREATDPVSIDIAKFVSITDGAIVVDLSSLEDGNYHISMPPGFAYGFNGDQVFINKSVDLFYKIQNEVPALSWKITQPYSDDYYQTYLSRVEVEFNQPIELVEGVKATVVIGETTYSYTPEISNETNLVVNFADIIIDEYAGEFTGKISVNIPAGIVTNGIEENTAINIDCMIVGTTNDYTVEPENGEFDWGSYSQGYALVTPEEFKNITITFNGFTNAEINLAAGDVTVTAGKEYYSYPLKDVVMISGNKVVLTLPDVKNEKYQINIPTLAFILDGTTGSQAIWLYYQVWDGMALGEALMEPETYSSMNVNPIELTWDYQELTQGDNWYVTAIWGYEEMIAFGMGGYIDIPAEAIKLVTVEKPNGGDQPSTQAEAGNALYIDLAPYMETHDIAYVTVKIPAGIVKNAEGKINPEQTFQFNVYNLWTESQPVCEETEESGVYNISWAGITYLSVTDSSSINPFIVGSDGVRHELIESNDPYEGINPGEYALTFFYDEDTWNYESYLTVNLNGMGLATGEYDLILPEALLILSAPDFTDYLNSEAYIPVYIDDTTSVETVSGVNEGIFRVYNLQGVKVLETEDASAIQNLNTGIYIVNGKKMLIRK